MEMNLIKQIKEWYQGKYIPPPENDPDSPVVFISTGHYEQSLLAKIIKFFILEHWKWTIGIILTIIGLNLSYLAIQTRPYLSINLTSRYLFQDKLGKSYLLYQIGNKEKTAYYKKGHVVFELPSKNDESCKHCYEKDKIDVLQPDETSAIHEDDIGNLDKKKSYKAQLIISYSDSDKRYGKKYLSLANLEFHPSNSNEIGHTIVQKTLGVGYVNERKIKLMINKCQELGRN